MRVCVLAHRKELLEQSGEKITVPFGYYSASVGEKDTDSQVIVAGIQSIYNKDFQPFDLIIVDECHRMPNASEKDIADGDAGQYWQFISRHPKSRIIGLTATPFRMNGGKLGWGDVVYEAKYPLLLEQGYLTPITNKVKNTPDLSSVKLVAGEYNEGLLSHVMEDPALIKEAVKNIIAYSGGAAGYERQSVLIFCVSVMHAMLLADEMQRNGLDSGIVHGNTPMGERELTLADFKSRRVKHLLNCEILLEGFDAPNVDMVVALRPTKSKALHEQMLGRGVRLYEGKTNCFLLDMAGNLQEHGGLGHPLHDKARKETKKPPGRICPECETFCAPTAKECPDCGYVFPREEPNKASHNYSADTDNQTVFTPLVEYEVTNVLYKSHISKAGNETLRVDYVCNCRYGSISEYYSPKSDNEWARGNVAALFKKRGNELISPVESYSIEDLIFHAKNLKKPSKIIADHNGKYIRIKDYIYEPQEHRTRNPESIDSLDALGIEPIPF